MTKPSKREIRLGIGNSRVPLHAHIAAFWESERDFAAAVGFLEEGLKGTDHCVIFGHDRANRETCRVLKEEGYDTDALQGEGRLAIVGPAATGEAVLDSIARAFLIQREAGARVIRLFGNIGWLEQGWPKVSELLEMEAKVTAAAEQFPCVVLCMYEARTVPAMILRHGALETHPFMIDDGSIRVNPWSVSPGGAPRDNASRSRILDELERVQEALRESEERFRLLADSAPVMIWETGADGRLSFLNKTAREFTGKSPEQLLGEGWRQGVHPEDLEQYVESFEAAFRSRVPYATEYRLRRQDGTYARVAEKGIPKLTGSRAFQGFIMTCFDITEINRMKEQLQRNNEMLELRVSERTRELREKDYLLLQQGRLAAMGELLGNIAHQWRQPLNLLGLLVQDLSRAHGTDHFSKEYLKNSCKRMLETIWHMSQTIEDFSSFCKPDKEKVDFRVVDVIQKTVALLKGNLDAQQIQLEVRQASDPVINGYPGALSQVLSNIIINATDAFSVQTARHRRIIIELFSEGSKTTITITDNAGGIAHSIIDRIFEPYFTTKGQGKGTGIGLYMSKNIIEKSMNGTLSAGNVDGGAQFRIELWSTDGRVGEG